MDSIDLETWYPWSVTNDIGFDPSDEKEDFGLGCGERRFVWELRQSIDPDARSMGSRTNYDIFAAEKKWEVKKLSNIRIESSGAIAAHETMRSFLSISSSISDMLQWLQPQHLETIDKILREHNLRFDELSVWNQKARESIMSGNIPKGLVHGNTSMWKIGFVQVLDALEKSVRDGQTDRTFIIGFGDASRKTSSVYDRDIKSDSMSFIKIIAQREGVVLPPEDFSLQDIVSSSFKLNGIPRESINSRYVLDSFLSAFDSNKILGHVDYVVVVDKERGFFVFEPARFNDYFEPSSISKSGQSLSPTSKLACHPGTSSIEKEESTSC